MQVCPQPKTIQECDQDSNQQLQKVNIIIVLHNRFKNYNLTYWYKMITSYMNVV